VAAELLEVTDLRVDIPVRSGTVHAVGGVSFSLAPGETLGVVGESGSGKTMVAMSVMRLLPPGARITGGSITVLGTDITSMREKDVRQIRGRDIGMVFQDPMTSLNPLMTLGSQIAEPVRAHTGASKAEAMARAEEVLGLVGMPRPAERLRNYPHELSGGLRQRAMIAMALACSPKLLIADEPTTALDVTIQDQILALLDDLRARFDMGLLLITHDMGVIADRADRVAVMYAGQLVETGDVATIFNEMRHPYTQALLESIPGLQADRSRALYSIPGAPPDLTRPPAGCRFAARCRYAQERCVEEEPQLTADVGGHQFACHFPVDGRRAQHLVGVDAALRGGALVGRPAGEVAGEVAGSPDPALEVRVRVDDPEPPVASGGRVLLRLDNVVKEFPIRKGLLRRTVGSVKAVSGVSLSVGVGETFGLVGESGCGKTTLGRLLVGLLEPDSGTIEFDGVAAAPHGVALKRHRKDVQLMFQDPYASLDPRMRVGSILREPLNAQKIGDRRQRTARIRQLLEEVGLPGRALALYPHEFSGGQRQRIGLARALTVEPRLVVADEPVSALDVSIQSQILNLMWRLQTERELSYVLISHDLSVVRYLADRVGVMYLGKLVEVGPVIDVYERSAHPYTAGLLEAVPVPDPTKRRTKAPKVRGELPSPANPPSGCRFRTRCTRAQEICAHEEPLLRPFGHLGHLAACHFPLAEPLSADQSRGAQLAGAPTPGAPTADPTPGVPTASSTAGSSGSMYPTGATS
jgi:peptide/nickel transport system ATP-binding protein